MNLRRPTVASRLISSNARGRCGQRAFTLLEVLIAVAAFAIVLAAINSVFYGALRLRNKTAEACEDALALQHTVALLRNDIANLLPPGGTLSGNLQTTPSATSVGTGSGLNASAASVALLAAASRPGQSSPEFYTTTGSIDETSPWAQVQKVSYYLTPSTNGSAGRDLVRSVTRNLLPSFQEQPAQIPLLTGVESIYFQYHDGTQWKDTWDSMTETASRLPAAVRVQIHLVAPIRGKLLPPPIELVVPVMVYGGTNSTASGGVR
jgi:prepilin-type N-terminal cleavage/methylation domain-containing protein